jgi:hypothetical protein
MFKYQKFQTKNKKFKKKTKKDNKTKNQQNHRTSKDTREKHKKPKKNQKKSQMKKGKITCSPANGPQPKLSRPRARRIPARLRARNRIRCGFRGRGTRAQGP